MTGARKRGRPREEETMDWRRTVRLPNGWAVKVERLARKRAVPVTIMLRLLIGERLEQLDDE